MIDYFEKSLAELKFGEKTLLKLKKIGIETVSDLLFYFPIRYDDFSKIKKISEIKISEIATIEGEIVSIAPRRIPFRRRLILIEALIKDETGAAKAMWFNKISLLKILKPGDKIRLAGKLSQSKNSLLFSNPSIEIANENKKFIHTGGLIPVYSASQKISAKFIRLLISRALGQMPRIEDYLPKDILIKYKFLDFNQAIKEIHFPKSSLLAEKAKDRFVFESIFLTQLVFLRQKINWEEYPSKSTPFDQKLIKDFINSLSFTLTNAQKKVIWQILQDIQKTKPMNRLLQGDVGSGKTIVALICALEIIKNGGQAAFVAPTEILATQHFEGAIKLLKDYRVKIGLLTSSQAKIYPSKISDNPAKMSKNFVLKKIAGNEINLIIGTHSLIQKNVKFKNLAFIIIDEQHRFGVEQRATVIRKIQKEVEESFKKEKSLYAYPKFKEQRTDFIPHFLSMSATPIPRSLALAIYGDLDFSVLDEMPPGRKKIITNIIEADKRKEAYESVRKEIKNGRQAFVICPRIDPATQINAERTQTNADINANNADNKQTNTNYQRKSASNQRKSASSWSDVKNVKAEYETLKKDIFPEFKIALLHGKTKSEEKEKIMADFVANKINILVATSVIEVGIDIKNATIMMIESAEKFGLAQLHQLRGRVGRGEHQSYCFIMLSEKTELSRKRLEILAQSEDGFKLAEMDLKLRGPGEFLGKKQSGIPDLIMQNLTDTKLIALARDEALKILKTDLNLKNYPLLLEKMKKFQNEIYKE